MPWRRTHDPYAIWVSEVMLQQTQVATVWPYFELWMARFPDVQTLANADEQEVLAMWQGLGYYRRCRMLHTAARQMGEQRRFPSSHEEWLKVSGVGRYTAAAVSSIAFDEPYPSVDGNFERVFARLTANGSAKPKLREGAWEWGLKNIDHSAPGEWNQAMMELGATLCTPRDPACDECPLRADCVGFQTGAVANFPAASAKLPTRQLAHLTWIPVHDGRMGVRQIPQGEWWDGMWEFPRVSLSSYEDASRDLRQLVGEGQVHSVGVLRHTVTTHRIKLVVECVRCEAASSSLRWLDPESLKAIPMPAPQRKALGQMSSLGLLAH